MARPTIFSEELADAICERLAAGESLIRICGGDDFLATGLFIAGSQRFRRFGTNTRKHDPCRLSAWPTKSLDIADDGRNDKWTDSEGVVRVDNDVIARSRLRVDARKWLMSKMLPEEVRRPRGAGNQRPRRRPAASRQGRAHVIVRGNAAIETVEVFEPLPAPARYKGAWAVVVAASRISSPSCSSRNAQRIPGTRAVCIREVQKTLKNRPRLIEDKIRAFGLAEGHGFRILNEDRDARRWRDHVHRHAGPHGRVDQVAGRLPARGSRKRSRSAPACNCCARRSVSTDRNFVVRGNPAAQD